MLMMVISRGWGLWVMLFFTLCFYVFLVVCVEQVLLVKLEIKQ